MSKYEEVCLQSTPCVETISDAHSTPLSSLSSLAITLSDIGPERRRQLYQSTGAPFHSAYALPQLRSLYKNNNVLTQSIVKWQTLSAIILNRWQGQTKNFRPISYSEASWTGLLNVRSCEWDRDALLLLPDDCQVALPDLCDFNEQTVVGITETMAEPNTGESNPYHARWPELRESCRFFGGLGDGVCANIGSKCSSPSRIAVTIGTSAAARVILPLEQSLTAESSIDEGFTVPSGLWCYRLDRSHIVLGGALTDGGSIVEWAQSFLNLKGDAFAECMKQVEGMMDDETKTEEVASSSTTTRVTVIPFLSGERSTGYRDGANCCVMGLTRETTPSMFLKACLEGVMLRVNAVVQLVKGSIAVMDDREDGQQPPYLVVSGAALERNEHWRQMLADVSGMEVKLDHNGSEGTSRGVARMIAIALFAATEQRDEEEQDEEEEEEENESNEMKEDSPLLLLEDEEIVSPTVSTPRLEATDGYWARAAKDQKDFIDAVSPLW
jgi:gluconokinase